jgi:hypothetical protein
MLFRLIQVSLYKVEWEVRSRKPGRMSNCQLLRIEGATWSAWRIPTALFSVFFGQEPLLFYQVAPQLYSRGWVDPVPDPLLFFLVVPGASAQIILKSVTEHSRETTFTTHQTESSDWPLTNKFTHKYYMFKPCFLSRNTRYTAFCLPTCLWWCWHDDDVFGQVSIICNCGWSRGECCRCSQVGDKTDHLSSGSGHLKTCPRPRHHSHKLTSITTAKTTIKLRVHGHPKEILLKLGVLSSWDIVNASVLVRCFVRVF